MSTSLAENIKLPSGYTLLDRLGAGGYGEVWKATAPGGVEKAIKIVFGHCDEGMAERELKSLERIKSVRHPFVLSIERYEIVNSRLVIVTELADMSLSDAFQRCTSEGHAGIPRKQLVSYLWDAAEALDCLVEQHSLQHLDIKPENLLVVGDHIKVADFGLVKELASQNLNSMMGGITPLYSAPEIFDDNPSSRSDQYSLGIVYQHMLTGSLPFPGRTPAQLAKQHTLSEPNLKPLSEADRQVIGKALAKDPAERFASCREFVTALQAVEDFTKAHTERRTNDRSPSPSKQIENDDTQTLAALDTKPLGEAISTAATRMLPNRRSIRDSSLGQVEKQVAKEPSLSFPFVSSEIEDIEVPTFELSSACERTPTLYVGVGGMGITMLREVRRQAQDLVLDPATESTLAWLAVDTERETLNRASGVERASALTSDDVLHIPLRRPKQYREASQDLLRWVSRRWLYNIPRSLQTRGFRPLGRIGVVDHAAKVLKALQSRLRRLSAINATAVENPHSIRVVLLSGMSGGTGGGTIIDLAQAVRSISQELALDVKVHGILGCTFHVGDSDSLAAANMYSLLTEINHAQIHGNCGESSPRGAASRYELPDPPFDEVYTIPVPNRGDRVNRDSVLQSIANFLLLEAGTNVGSLMDAIRSREDNSDQRTFLRNFSCINLGHQTHSIYRTHQELLTKAILRYWLTQVPNTQGNDVEFFEQHANSQFAHEVLAHFPSIPSVDHDSTDDELSRARTTDRTTKIRLAARGFMQFLETCEMGDQRDELFLSDREVGSVSDQIVERFCAILSEGENQDLEVGQVLSTILGEQVNQEIENSSTLDPSQIASCALSRFQESPLDCGCSRWTVLITPQDVDDPKLLEAFNDACHTLAHYEIACADSYLIRESRNFHPVHLAARLAGDFPDIPGAASRLHARSDIDWQDLRSVRGPESACLS